MTTEEKVEYLERKVMQLEVQLMNTLEVLKYYVHIDRGLSNQDTVELVDKIDEIEQDRVV